MSSKWIPHDDPDLDVKGFRIGDRVQWSGRGARLTILMLLQLASDETRWYAYLEDDKGGHFNFDLDFLIHVEVVTRLGDIARD